MAYPDFHSGAYDPGTGRGTLWRDLTASEQTALRAELGKGDYTGLSDQDTALLLLSKQRTGPTTRTVAVNEVHRRDIIGAAGGVMFLVTLKTAAGVNAALLPVYDWIMSEDTYVVNNAQFDGALTFLNSLTVDAQGTKLLPDAALAAIRALGSETQPIPDDERALSASRAEMAGLPALLLTADDVRAARSN